MSQMQRSSLKKKKRNKSKADRAESGLMKKSPIIDNIDSNFAISKQHSEHPSLGKPVTFEKSEIAKEEELPSSPEPRKKKSRR